MRLLTFIILLVTTNILLSAPRTYVEGTHYERLPKKVSTITGDKIEVTEAFSYLCGACYRFEPTLNSWKKGMPDDVELVKLHVIYNGGMKKYAQILYTAEALGVEDKITPAVFKAIHIQKNRLANIPAIQKFFEAHGVPGDKFRATFNSFNVDMNARRANQRTKSMLVKGTPQMIVDGQYSVSVTKDIDHKKMLDIVDYLVAMIRLKKQVKAG